MRLTPGERDRLLLFTAAELARARLARGLRLNVPEATALIADTVAEAARDGRRLGEAIDAGRSVLTRDDVLPGVPEVVTQVQVEAVFDDGARLAVITEPFDGTATSTANGRERAESEATAPAPGVTRSGAETAPVGKAGDAEGHPAPGTVIPGGELREPSYQDVVQLPVTNTATVPITVTSHYHFFEVNPRLLFDRAAAYGRRLAIPAGSTQRFDPGQTVEVPLTGIGGGRVAIGFAGLVDGPLDAPGAKEAALHRARECGYLGAGDPA